MAYILLPHRSRRVPSGPQQLRGNNPLTAGMLAFVPLHQPGEYRNLVDGRTPDAGVYPSTPARVFTHRDEGRMYSTDRVGTYFSGSEYLRWTLPGTSLVSGPMLACGLIMPNGTWPAARQDAVTFQAQTGTNESGLRFGTSTAPAFQGTSLSSTGGVSVSLTGTSCTGQRARRMFYACGSGSNRTFWEEERDGLFSTTSQPLTTLTSLYIGGRYDGANTPGSNAYAGGVEYAAVWSTGLGFSGLGWGDSQGLASFAREFNDYPWQVCEPYRRRLYVHVGGGPSSQDITSVGAVASAEAHGTQNVALATVQATGIASAEAHGTQSVANATVQAAGIASAEAHGTQNIALASTVLEITPTGIASAEAHGTARLDLNVTPSGLAPSNQFGTARVEITEIKPTGIATGESVPGPYISIEGAPPPVAWLGHGTPRRTGKGMNR